MCVKTSTAESRPCLDGVAIGAHPLLILQEHFSDRHLSDSACDSKAPVSEQVLDQAQVQACTIGRAIRFCKSCKRVLQTSRQCKDRQERKLCSCDECGVRGG